jgi:hypothetical protein
MHSSAVQLRFGFLQDPFEFKTPEYEILPLSDHEARRNSLLLESHRDGYFYPPQVSSYTSEFDRTAETFVPRSTRPTQMFQLCASHTLRICKPIKSVAPFSDAIFLTQVLAFLNGTRLQLDTLRFDTRIPFESVLGARVNLEVQANFLARSYQCWKVMDAEQMSSAVNIFYAFNRANGAEFEWDMFMQQYIVLDAIYRYYVNKISCKTRHPHKDRIAFLCKELDLQMNVDLIDRLVRARNDLFHEGMWAGAVIGFAEQVPDAIHLPRHLRRLNARLLCAVSGYQNSFTRSVWWAMGAFPFD